MLLTVTTEVSSYDLAQHISQEMGREDLLDFVMTLDECRADLSFTQRLYAELGEAIRAELEEDENE